MPPSTPPSIDSNSILYLAKSLDAYSINIFHGNVSMARVVLHQPFHLPISAL